jgi:hypothetical protein
MGGEQHVNEIPAGYTWVGGHLVALPDHAAHRDRDAQGARAVLAREIAQGQVVAGTNTVPIRRYGSDFSEDSTQSWDDPRRKVELPPDRADAARRHTAALARDVGRSQQLSGSSTTASDPRNDDDYDRRYERRVDGRIALSYTRRSGTAPIDWSAAPEGD